MTFALDTKTTAKPAGLPWSGTRRDMRQTTKLLACADLATSTELGAAVQSMLFERTRECRDLFAARGVNARRLTVLQLAGRSLAADRDQIARIDAIAPGFGQSLLRALSRMIEQWAATGQLAMA